MIDLRALKLLRTCADCGYDANADALQFDHLPEFGKATTVAARAGSDRTLASEIAKCEVVCANCHAIRTASRTRAA